jgi:hypothetical protein
MTASRIGQVVVARARRRRGRRRVIGKGRPRRGQAVDVADALGEGGVKLGTGVGDTVIAAAIGGVGIGGAGG